MKSRTFLLYFIFTIFLAAILVKFQAPISVSRAPTGGAPEGVQSRLEELYGKLPLYFIENQGQLDARVAYYVQGGNKNIYFTAEGVTYGLTAGWKAEPESFLHPASFDRTDTPREPDLPKEAQRWVLKLDFVDANPDVQPVGLDPTDAVISYFKGPREAWNIGVPTYAGIAYRGLWPGIDLIYSGTSSRLKYTFLVHPGADPDQIKLAYRGASKVAINEAGQLEVSTSIENFYEDKPYVYQEVGGQRREVTADYILQSETSGGVPFGFRVGDYDREKVLFLDPVVVLYAGYIGGAGDDVGNDIAVDADGNVYIAGSTSSSADSFPVTAGPDVTWGGGNDCGLLGGAGPCPDAFVAKVDASGERLIYAGYIGGSGNDNASGIAIDSAGNAYVSGTTNSSQASFPVTVGPDLSINSPSGVFGLDAFVAKINRTGTALLYAGYIGGGEVDQGNDIAVDGNGNAYITGVTNSKETSFPVRVGPDLTHNGASGLASSAFVAKVNAAGTALDYAGYIGGSIGDIGMGIAVDAGGNAYVTGRTFSKRDFPVVVGPDLTFNGADNCGVFPFQDAPCSDAFVAKVNAAGTGFVYAGLIGGRSTDVGVKIAVDRSGSAYVMGNTSSDQTSFPARVGPDTTFNGGTDVFVAKVNPAGTDFVYAGYIGGSADDSGTGIAVDSAGNAYLTGETRSDQFTFPVTAGPDLTFNGGAEAFVAKVNPSGTALDYAGYIGGLLDDRGTGIAVDSLGNAYVTGSTRSSEASFPVMVGPDMSFNGVADAFVARIGEQALGPPVLPPNSVVNGASFRPATDPNGAIAPGSIVAVFGTNLAGSINVAAAVPLPTTLENTTVTFNGVPAPLFFVSPTQINVQLPFEVAAGTASVQVKRDSLAGLAQPVRVASVSPGIIGMNSQGSGQGAILIHSTGELAAPPAAVPGFASRPASRGDFLAIYCTGLGDVSSRPDTGAAAPINPLSNTVGSPTVTVGGVSAEVAYSGLAPGFVGLYQVNAQVPPGAPSGNAVAVVLTIGGVRSNTVTIAVQ